MEEGGEQEKKRSIEREREKIRALVKYNFSKKAWLGSWRKARGRQTMQRCADPGIYRRSLEHWAIGGRVRVRGGGRGG